MSEEAVKKAVQRLRQRYQEVIREEIGRTVATASEIDEELRYLWSVLGA
jgi:RNA polymerase sigma-70 factor (ECF subfamily)